MNFLKEVDAFRAVSKDLTRGSSTGGIFTVLAYALLVLLLLAEVGAFLRVSYATNVTMDANTDVNMQLNFDVSVFDLPCKYLKLAVFDKFGQEQVKTENQFHYIPLDHKGDFKGQAYSPEEIAVLEQTDIAEDLTDEEKAEIDADWSSSSDHFKHKDFTQAVTFHDYTLVNFYAEWCSHCRQFHPTWMEFKDKVDEKMSFTDADGNQVTVKVLKMNCVDFQAGCQTAQIAAFPTIRLYKKDGKFEQFNQQRSIDNLIDFLTQKIKSSHLIRAQHHLMFAEGCQVQGSLQVPRVPGHFYLQAEAHGSLDVNPQMTNVSHRVNHFSFGDKNSKNWAERNNIPKDMVAHINPLDGKTFTAEHFHEAPQHYLKVVSTHVEGKKDVFYQMTHSDRVRKLKKRAGGTFVAPQARFSYDFSPMSVVVKVKSKRWYEFLTSLFAILGGTYTVMELLSGTVDTVSSTIKEAMGKAN